MNLYTYFVKIDNIERSVLSFLEPGSAFTKGFTGKSVIGFLKQTDKGVLPENIVYNPDFIEIFKRAIKIAALDSPDLESAATSQQNGFIYIIDRRSKNNDETKSKDIIGSFEVTQGQLNDESFQFNPNYQIISSEGIFQLPEDFEKVLLKEIEE
ncbi:MAG: hypothetical protein QM762_18035 [Chryseolinea sp.]